MTATFAERQPDGTEVIKTIAEISEAGGSAPDPLAHFDVSGDGNQPNTTLTLSSNREDGAWSEAGNVVTYSGSPDRVRITAMAGYENPTDVSGKQRICPELELIKNGTQRLAVSASGYQRHNSGANTSSNTISFIDPDPGVNPNYRLRAQQGGNQNDVEQIDIGHFSLEAVV